MPEATAPAGALPLPEALPPRRHGWGWRKQRPDFRDFPAVPKLSTLRGLKPTSDLRAGAPYLPWDQGAIGSCVFHAWGHLFAVARKRAGRRMWMPSRLFGYYAGREMEGTVAVDSGLELRTGAKVISKLGLPPESYWTYADPPAGPDGSWRASDKPRRRPPAEAYTAAERYQGLTFAAVRQDLTHLRGMLAEGWPIAFGFMVYSSLYDRMNGRPLGVVPMPTRADFPLGGHAVVLCGHNDGPDPLDLGGGHALPAAHFLCRNSWGRGAQMAGHFALPYAYVLDNTLSADFWTLTATEK